MYVGINCSFYEHHLVASSSLLVTPVSTNTESIPALFAKAISVVGLSPNITNLLSSLLGMLCYLQMMLITSGLGFPATILSHINPLPSVSIKVVSIAADKDPVDGTRFF